MSDDLSWMDRIACAGMDPALFFARAGKSDVAELICAKCPVQEQCSAWAGDATVGVWGGESRTRKPAAPKPKSKLHGKETSMSYSDEDWQRAEKVSGEALADAMGWTWSVADSAMARIVLEAARDELERGETHDIVDGPNGIELVPRTTRNERGAA